MSPTRIICTLFLAVAPSLLAKEHEFRFDRPDAQSVDLMGEFNQWKGLAMTRQANGTWTVKVSIPPGTYGHKFLVDGKDWVFDPTNSGRKTVEGVENSAIQVNEEVASSVTVTASPNATFVAVCVPSGFATR
jgi:1,4-alpha-glucan branching enzyme